MKRPRPLVLVILDGFGERAESADNAVRLANAPRLAELFAKYPHGLIGTSGPDVGLPPGQMGNSEVGHLNFGAGRIAMMDISRIDNAVFDGSLGKNPVLRDLFAKVEAPATTRRAGRLHLLGLCSDGGVHSLLTQIEAVIDAANGAGITCIVHAFLDGRDVQPRTALRYIAELENHLVGKGVIGTVGGRYYGMDRDNRWERVQKAFDAIATAKGPRHKRAIDGIEASFAAGKTDEFVEPFVVGDYDGVHEGKDVAFHCNFRPDRARELTRALAVDGAAEGGTARSPNDGSAKFDGFDRGGAAPFAGRYGCMTTYDASLGLPVAFPKTSYPDIFPEVIARAGLTQFRCAETEKYAHVTYFFNGGREEPFDGEERAMIPSPKEVATYDLKPEMSAKGVGEAVVHAIESDRFDFVLVNFANPDMVGHTGVLDAAVHAVEAVDAEVGAIADAARAKGGALIITADHGNCELMKDPATGQPHTAHTLNPVPLLYVNDADASAHLRHGGRICDVAPTMLALLGLPQPAAMTGVALIEAK